MIEPKVGSVWGKNGSSAVAVITAVAKYGDVTFTLYWPPNAGLNEDWTELTYAGYIFNANFTPVNKLERT